MPLSQNPALKGGWEGREQKDRGLTVRDIHSARSIAT